MRLIYYNEKVQGIFFSYGSRSMVCTIGTLATHADKKGGTYGEKTT